MNYWKGLMYAAAIDLVWIMGCPFIATEPTLPPPPPPPLAVTADSASIADPSVAELADIDRQVDSLMMYLQEHVDDVDATQMVADLYAENEWYEAAIGPLARALQLDPSRRSLWVALDRAVEKSGLVKITDAELVRRANAFVETVASWGHGC